MKKKKILSIFLTLAISGTIIGPSITSAEIVADGYEINMDNLPKIHLGEHEQWERLYNAAWSSHKNNIRKVQNALNPELTNSEKTSYYVDEAFDNRIFQWDTLFMMLFDKYGINEFPTLNSMENFYYHQVDSAGNDDGFIDRMIYENTGQGYYGNNYQILDAINPPLFGWAEWEQYKVHGDVKRFTKEVKGKAIIDRISSLYQFIKRTRRITDGPMAGFYVSNGQGNGLDNTPNQGGWNEAANDMTLQQVQASEYIIKICNEIIEKDEDLTEEERSKYEEMAISYKTERIELIELIQEKMWSEEGSFFFNANNNTGEFTNIVTPTGLWALVSNVATEEQAKEMIETYALNSNKLFRPNGLATTAYDYNGRKDGSHYNSSFKPTGGYWNGAMWSPTSYQWIKGLNQYGYHDLAFQEAVRHIEALSDVYEAGAADRNGQVLNTLWENYSSEYTKPGSTEFNDMQPSRSNFVGWTGALAIATMIENVVGITLDGQNNMVEWNVNLIEEHGISNLYMKNHEGNENRISLMAEERVSGSSTIEITSTADYPYILKVTSNGETVEFNVEAGTQTIRFEGTDNEVAYMDAAIHDLSIKKDTLTKEYLDANAKDYVIFTDTDDESIDDGLKKQLGKEYKGIYNVNTVGYREWDTANPTTMRENDELKSLGFENAQDYVKTSHVHGEEGFMLMAPASNEMQTLKVIVGVENATAKITANISDGSQAEVNKILTGGDKESVYVIEIPYRAASQDKNIMVEYVITEDKEGKEGKISLKGIVLEDGGNEILQPLSNVTAISSDSTLTVNGESPEGVEYDSYKILAGKDINNFDIVKEVESLPADLTDLENYKKYYVAVIGIKDGVESGLSNVVSEIPEALPRTDKERAYSDYKEVEELILNGNEGFDSILSPLKFDISNTTYGSTFEFSTSTNGEEYGVMNNGSIKSPIKPLDDKKLEITIKVTCGDETVTIVKEAIVKAKDVNDIPYVVGEVSESPTAYTIESGSKDWILFNTSNISNYEKKLNGDSILDIKVIGGASGEVENNMITNISYTDGTNQASGSSKKSIYYRNNGNGIEFTVPYSEKMQNLKIFAGVWQAGANVEILVNDEVLYTNSFKKVDGTNGVKCNYFDVNFKVPNETDVVKVKITTSDNADNQWGGGFTAIQGIILTETEDSIPTPEPPDNIIDKNFNVTFKEQPSKVNLTEVGNKDWMLFNNIDLNKIENKNGTRFINNLRFVNNQNPQKLNPNSATATFSYSNGTNNESGTHNKGIVFEGLNRGVEFELPYSLNEQQANIYIGAWAAKIKFEATVERNGEVIKNINSEFDMSTSTSGSPAEYKVFKLNYKLENQNDVVRVKVYTDKLYDNNWGNMSLAAITLSEKYSLKVDSNITGGSIDLNKLSAAKGDVIEVSVLADEGKILKEGSLKYTTSEGKVVEIENNQFKMPNSNIVISAEFVDESSAEKNPDLNNNGKIDIGDLAIVSSNYGSNKEDYDFNNDGMVNELDISYITEKILSKKAE